MRLNKFYACKTLKDSILSLKLFRLENERTLIRIGDWLLAPKGFYCFCVNNIFRMSLAVCLVASVVVLVVGRLRQLKSGDVVEVQHLQHLLRLSINLDDVLLQSRHLRNVVITAFTLLLLQLDGDSAHL